MKTDIKNYGFKTGLPQKFEIVDLVELYKDFEKVLTTTHRAGFYHIIWFQEGNPIHLVDFNPMKIKPNTLLFLNKDTVQRFDKKIKFQGKAILFTDSFFCKTESDTNFLRTTILYNDLFSVSQIQIDQQTQLFTAILQQMQEELQKKKDYAQADILKNLLHNFLLQSERIKREQNFVELKKDADFNYVMLFKYLLEEHYKSQKQVSYYAKEMFISEKRLNHATSKIFGKKSKEFISDRVMLEAKRILAHTSKSVKEICYFLGFEEPTNFIKYFKKHSSVTPTEFRERNTVA